jgi:hypothetical protein
MKYMVEEAMVPDPSHGTGGRTFMMVFEYFAQIQARLLGNRYLVS